MVMKHMELPPATNDSTHDGKNDNQPAGPTPFSVGNGRIVHETLQADCAFLDWRNVGNMYGRSSWKIGRQTHFAKGSGSTKAVNI